MVGTLIENHEKSGIMDEKRELLIKNAAGQIYGGTLHLWPILSHLMVYVLIFLIHGHSGCGNCKSLFAFYHNNILTLTYNISPLMYYIRSSLR